MAPVVSDWDPSSPPLLWIEYESGDERGPFLPSGFQDRHFSWVFHDIKGLVRGRLLCGGQTQRTQWDTVIDGDTVTYRMKFELKLRKTR